MNTLRNDKGPVPEAARDIIRGMPKRQGNRPVRPEVSTPDILDWWKTRLYTPYDSFLNIMSYDKQFATGQGSRLKCVVSYHH